MCSVDDSICCSRAQCPVLSQACGRHSLEVHASPVWPNSRSFWRHSAIGEQHASVDVRSSLGLAEYRRGCACRHPCREGDPDRGGERIAISGCCDGCLRPGVGPGGDCSERNWREVACGMLSFHDAYGIRLSTIGSIRMPQSGKTDLNRWLAQECNRVLKRQPDLTPLTIADGASDNWTSAFFCSVCSLRYA